MMKFLQLIGLLGFFAFTLSVAPAQTAGTAQSITFPALSNRTYGDAPVALTATASSGLPVSYSVVSGNGSVAGSSLELTGGGAIVVEATQSGNATYAPATPVRQTLNVSPRPVAITISNLAHTYDGYPKFAAVASNPSLPLHAAPSGTLILYYNGWTPYGSAGGPGSADTLYPAAVGEHTVRCVASSSLQRYTGEATATLRITPANVALTLSNLTHTADGSAKSVSVATSPDTAVRPQGQGTEPMRVAVTYNGSATPPSAAGNYAVVATVTSYGYTGTASGTLTISAPPGSTPPPPPATTPPPSTPPPPPANPPPPTSTPPPAALAPQIMTFPPIGTRAFGAAPFPVSATTSSGLPISFAIESGPATISGNTLTLTGAGNVTVRALQSGNATFAPASASQSFTVAPATAILLLGNLNQLAEGGPRSVYVETTPPGLATRVTYNGSTDAPSAPGTFAVNATITDPNYTGSASGTLVITPLTPTGNPSVPAIQIPTRLANVSTRGRAAAAGEPLIAGFVIDGAGPKQVLVRAVGPALRPFGVIDAVSAPRLALYRGEQLIAENSGWSTATNANELAAAARAVGAFAFTAGSSDAALLATLEAGAYTAVVSNTDGSAGSALAEIYEVSPGASRLANLSTRGAIGAGSEVLIAGLVVSGDTPRTVLVRAVGPGLRPFNVANALADPRLKVVRASAVIAENTGWRDDAPVRDVGASVGAFTLAARSADAAVVLTLPPGAYSVVVDSATGASGTVLLEVYDAAAR